MQVPRRAGLFQYNRSDSWEVAGQNPPASAALPFHSITSLKPPEARKGLCFCCCKLADYVKELKEG